MRKSIGAIIGNRYWREEFDRGVRNPPIEILAPVRDFMVDDRSSPAPATESNRPRTRTLTPAAQPGSINYRRASRTIARAIFRVDASRAAKCSRSRFSREKLAAIERATHTHIHTLTHTCMHARTRRTESR